MLFNVWVTTNCNLCCTYCYEGAHRQGRNMDHETAERILEYISKRIQESYDQYIVVNYHGGEPLLNYKIIVYMTEELNKRFSSKGVLFGITTNGTLLDKEKSEFLRENFYYNLSISMDGTKSVHDLNRKNINGEGSYEDIIERIKPILRERKDVRARMTYTPETVAFLSESVRHLIDVGFHNIVPVPNYYDKNWTTKHALILESEILSLYSQYAESDIHISVLEPDFHIAKGRCNAGIGEINIDCSGNIYPCTCMVGNDKYQAGSVTDVNKEKILNILSVSEKTSSQCNGCGLEHWCIGARCKMVNKMITGDYGTAPSFLCAETNALYSAYCKVGGK